MNLPMIEMDTGTAREAFLEYRQSAKRGLDRELELLDDRRAETAARMREIDEATARAYRLLSLGHRIISLQAAFKAAGEDEQHRPRLAVARADEPRIELHRWTNGTVRMGPQWVRGRQANSGRRQRSFQFAGYPRIDRGVNGLAVVPTIPPRLRPDSLETYHILWEPDWQELPPVDPALLRSLGGDLYAVVAVWDLTEVERLVLGLQTR